MQLSMPQSLLRDSAFQHRVQDRLADSAQQVNDGWPRQLRLETWMLPSLSRLGWKHGESSPQPAKRSSASPGVGAVLCTWLAICSSAVPCLNGLKGCFMAGGDTKIAAHYRLFWLLCVQVLEGMLEGAFHLCSVLRVIGNLLSTRCDAELLDHFCQELNVPLSLLCLAKQILESGVTKQVSVEPQGNVGACRVLVLRRPWCPAGPGSSSRHP